MPVLSKPEDPVSMEMKARLEELQREFEKMKQQLNQAQEQAKAQPGAAAENPTAASDLAPSPHCGIVYRTYNSRLR